MAGVYYIHIRGGVTKGSRMEVGVYVGVYPLTDGVTGKIYHWHNDHDGVDTISHGFLLTLEVGKQVWVRAEGKANYGLYSNSNLVSGFSGFLLYIA